MNSSDISVLLDSVLLAHIREVRQQITQLTELKFLLLEEARNRVDPGGGMIVTDEHVAIIGSPLEIQMIDTTSIRNQFSKDELTARNLFLVKNRRAAVRVYCNPSNIKEDNK